MQHYTSKGIPFYVNLPSNIVARCLGMANIAKAISRFPVKCTGEVRSVLVRN